MRQVFKENQALRMNKSLYIGYDGRDNRNVVQEDLQSLQYPSKKVTKLQ